MPLDKLVERILDDAREYGEKIVSEAKVERLEALERADEEARRAYSEILESARLSADMEKQQRVTAAVIETRKKMLEAKQRAISSVIARAAESVLARSREEYVRLLLSRLAGLGEEAGGELVLSPADRERVGEEFVLAANRAAGKREGPAPFTLSEDSREMLGGFVLKSDGREINCSLDAQIESRREELEEAIVKVVFRESPSKTPRSCDSDTARGR